MKKVIHCIALFFVFLSSLPAFADYDVDYSERDHYQLVQFRGKIEPFESRKPLQDVLLQIHGKKDIILKVDRSLGGWGPAYVHFVRSLKSNCSKQRGSECKVVSLFTAYCASACTQIPLLTDYSVSLPDARFAFHRKWLIDSDLTIESKKAFVKRYVKMGANQKWFEDNQELLTSDQENCYLLPKYDEVESGLIDRQVGSMQEFFDMADALVGT